MTDDEKRELIAELRDYATALRASVHVHHTGADLIENGADALEGTLTEPEQVAELRQRIRDLETKLDNYSAGEFLWLLEGPDREVVTDDAS